MSNKIFTVYKSELRARLCSVSGWLYISVAMLGIGLSTAIMNLLGTYSNPEYALEMAAMALGIGTPLLCSLSLSAQKRRGESELLLRLISPRELTLGRYLAHLTLLALPALTALLLPLILGFMGKVYLPSAYWGAAGYILYGAALTAICGYICELIPRPLISFFVGVGVFALMTVSGNLATSLSDSTGTVFFAILLALMILLGALIHFYLEKLSVTLIYAAFATATLITAALCGVTPELARWSLSALSLSDAYSKLIYGTASLSGLLRLILTVPVFLGLTTLRLGRAKGVYSGKQAASVCSILTAAALIASNAVNLLPAQAIKYDTTPTELFTLSDVTRDKLEALDTDVTAYVIDENGIPDTLTVEKVLERYAGISRRIKLKSIHPTEAAAEYGELSHGSVVIRSELRHTVISERELLECTEQAYASAYEYYYYFVEQGLVSSSFYEFLNTYGSELGMFDLAAYELMLTTAIDYVTKSDVTKLYCVSSHGETALNGNVASILKRSFVGVFSCTLENGVPNDADVLLMLSPVSDVTDAEYSALETYLSHGGRLALVTAYKSSEKLPKLMSLCESYGLATDGGFLCDGSEENSYQGYPQILLPFVFVEKFGERAPDSAHSPLLGAATGITLTATEGITQRSLVGTGSFAYSVPDIEERENAEFIEGTDTYAEYSLAAIAENEAGGGLLWFSSPAFNDETYDTMVMGGNFSVFAAAIALFTNADMPLPISTTPLVSAPLEVSDTAVTAGFALAVIIPCAILLSGLAVILRRRKRADALYGE